MASIRSWGWINTRCSRGMGAGGGGLDHRPNRRQFWNSPTFAIPFSGVDSAAENAFHLSAGRPAAPVGSYVALERPVIARLRFLNRLGGYLPNVPFRFSDEFKFGPFFLRSVPAERSPFFDFILEFSLNKFRHFDLDFDQATTEFNPVIKSGCAPRAREENHNSLVRQFRPNPRNGQFFQVRPG
ncbi:MAG: hypothetical protein IIA14_04730 [SAR324 cluster bacterium]|nr:hypothetical protein [SAR324 cluster bacterium]